MNPPNDCQCQSGCSYGWCLHEADLLILRDGAEIWVCHNCWMHDTRIANRFGWVCAACQWETVTARGALCGECELLKIENREWSRR